GGLACDSEITRRCFRGNIGMSLNVDTVFVTSGEVIVFVSGFAGVSNAQSRRLLCTQLYDGAPRCSASSASSSGMQEPQLVPARSTRPMSAVVTSDRVRIASINVPRPTAKHEQT